MNLVTNKEKNKNHLSVISELLRSSDKIVLCSGWMSIKGLNKIKKDLVFAKVTNKSDIKIFMSEKKMKTVVSKELSKLDIPFVHVNDTQRTLHSKIYYFEHKNEFTALIGSANITSNGLEKSEELSVIVNGKKGTSEQKKINLYLNKLANMYKNTNKNKV